MIITFYSYKGGVGRSMALANIGDALARAGLNVLMIDFDLEAPGLEQFFRIDHREVRGHQGLLDLLLSYKQAMSQASHNADKQPAFRRLRELYILPVYNQLPSGGRLDLLPAGQRGNDEQLARYALNLRTFDWQDFYFNWAGELFFDWFRNTLVSSPNPPYDVVLVDSRTGVTEMGGICAYQLADAILMFCASNQQNLQGTRNVIEHFLSPRVQELRRHRPLQVLVVPSRIEQREDRLLTILRKQFEEAFASHLPQALQKSGVRYWDLLIPYEPNYAFEEQVVPPMAGSRPHPVAAAYKRLVDAIVLLAEPDTRIANLRFESAIATSAIPQYDVTRQMAGYDVFLTYVAEDTLAVRGLAEKLRKNNLSLFDVQELERGTNWEATIETALKESSAVAVFVGPSGKEPWKDEYIRAALEQRLSAQSPVTLIPVLLPGTAAREDRMLPNFLLTRTWVDFRKGLYDSDAFDQLQKGIIGKNEGFRVASVALEDVAPYKGLSAFREEDARFLFGREAFVDELIDHLRTGSFVALLGASGSGKSSLIYAGVIPALKAGAIGNSASWRYITLRPGSTPVRSLATALAALASNTDSREKIIADRDIEEALRLRRPGLQQIVESITGPQQAKVLLVVDQFEELWTQTQDPEEREQFIELFVEAAAVPSTELILVFVMRADFLIRVTAHSRLTELFSNHLVMMGPMSREELRSTIELPAQQVGLAFEPGLVESILNDVADSPGALPLLQFFLRQLWERRRRGFLSHKDYQQIGGLFGALAGYAEQIMDRLAPSDKEVARKLWLSLVQVGESSEYTRGRVPLDELITTRGNSERIKAVVAAFTEHRLFVTSSDSAGERWVEIAHEAVIRGWPRLRGWINDAREWLRVRQRLNVVAQDWLANERSTDFLYHGEHLARTISYVEEHSNELGLLEREFLDSSQAFEDSQNTHRRRFLYDVVWILVLAFSIFPLGIVLNLLKIEQTQNFFYLLSAVIAVILGYLLYRSDGI